MIRSRKTSWANYHCSYFRLFVEQGRRSFFFEINWDILVKGSLQTKVPFFLHLCVHSFSHSFSQQIFITDLLLYVKHCIRGKSVQELIKQTYLSHLGKSPVQSWDENQIVTRNLGGLRYDSRYSGDCSSLEYASSSTLRHLDSNVLETLTQPKKIWPSLWLI